MHRPVSEVVAILHQRRDEEGDPSVEEVGLLQRERGGVAALYARSYPERSGPSLGRYSQRASITEEVAMGPVGLPGDAQLGGVPDLAGDDPWQALLYTDADLDRRIRLRPPPEHR